MILEEKVPENLKNQQFWFGSIIGQPLNDNCIQTKAPSGCSIEEEAALFIAKSPTLEPWERMEIYNQQYWWRLLKILQSIYPLLTRLFGYQDFNKSIAVPYLLKYPSDHWSVDRIGDRLQSWLLENYKAIDAPLVFHAASIDFAISDAFDKETLSPIDLKAVGCQQNIGQLLNRTIYLQPWVHLFAFEYDLFTFREELLKEEVEYWEENDFPEIDKAEKTYYFVVWRNPSNHVVWNYLSEAEYLVLKAFETGNTIEKTCEWLEMQDQQFCDLAMTNIHYWFQEWTLRNWLTLKRQKK